MATTYCTVGDISDFLRVPITSTTSPNKAQVEKIIKRKEAELDRRTGHAWRSKTITKELHDLPLLYTFGWGTPIFLQHRNIYEFDVSAGDKIEIWQGASANWENILGNAQWYDVNYERGTVHLRGFIFSILRKNRVRITYRYGGEGYAGDTVIPLDIEDAIVKLTAIELVNTSLRMDRLPMGGTGVDLQAVKARWAEDVEKCIDNRREVFVIP
jgi:hypothetical protein|tara:strand:+ start:1674 stop:2312 length:639 start_codon:yes stop_codon:yes gene_type:complete